MTRGPAIPQMRRKRQWRDFFCKRRFFCAESRIGGSSFFRQRSVFCRRIRFLLRNFRRRSLFFRSGSLCAGKFIFHQRSLCCGSFFFHQGCFFCRRVDFFGNLCFLCGIIRGSGYLYLFRKSRRHPDLGKHVFRRGGYRINGREMVLRDKGEHRGYDLHSAVKGERTGPGGIDAGFFGRVISVSAESSPGVVSGRGKFFSLFRKIRSGFFHRWNCGQSVPSGFS